MLNLVLKPLGDQAVLAYLLDEAAAVRFAAAVQAAGFAWLLDVVPAYTSVGVYFDPEQVSLSQVRADLRRVRPAELQTKVGRLHVVPCCYEMALDLGRVAELKGVTPDRIIELHLSAEYSVYAIGFAPGFPYLGYLPAELTGVPRLATPRMRVEPGMVGLAARQTGIYTLPRPGGWNLIGRTPLELVNIDDGYFPLRVGDRIRFKRIDAAKYEHLQGERLPV